MVNHLTELETTDDGAISIGSLIAYLKKSKEFQEVFKGLEEIEYLRSIAYVSAKAVKDFEDRKVSQDDPRLSDARNPLEHTHDISEIKGLDTYSKKDIETLIIAACTKLKKDIENLDDNSKIKLKEFVDKAKKDNEKLKNDLNKRIEKLESESKTIVQKVDDNRIDRIEKNNTELLTILNNIIDKAEEDLSKVVKDLSAKFEKRIVESKKKIEIIGGPTPYQPLAIRDEGTQITAEAKSLNFTGSGVTATNNNGNVIIDITGGGSGDRYKTTSTTSNTIVSTGSLTFTVDAGLSYIPLQEVVIVHDLSNHMHGTITSYSGTTLIVDITHKTGSGTYNSWTINLDGTPVDAVTGSGTTGSLSKWSAASVLTDAVADTDYLTPTTAATTYVPNTGATVDVDLGSQTISADSGFFSSRLRLGGVDVALTGSDISIFNNDVGYLTVNQTITLSGDVTGSGNTAITTTVISASTTQAGKVELATVAETNTGTDATRAITPDALAGSYAGTKSVNISVFASDANVETGDGKAYLTIPESANGMNLVRATARVITAGTTGDTTIQIHNVTQAADMLTGLITIASGGTLATAGTIDTANDDVATNDLLRVDVDSVSTTAPQGLIVILEFRLP